MLLVLLINLLLLMLLVITIESLMVMMTIPIDININIIRIIRTGIRRKPIRYAQLLPRRLRTHSSSINIPTSTPPHTRATSQATVDNTAVVPPTNPIVSGRPCGGGNGRTHGGQD